MWRVRSASSFSVLVSERWIVSGAWYLLASCARSLQIGVVIGVDRVRRHGGNNQRIIVVLLQKLFGEPQHVLGRGGVGRFEANHGLAQNRAHARFFGGLRGAILEIIHVDERGGARKHHLQARQARAPQHEIRRHILGFRGEDEFIEPVLQLHVVGDAAKQRHGGVGVRVDQARHQDVVRAVEMHARLKLFLDVGALADAHDALAANGHCSVINQVVMRVHSHHVAGSVDRVGRLAEAGQTGVKREHDARTPACARHVTSACAAM